MKPIKGVVFDLDGTIADTLPLCIWAFRSSIEPLLGSAISDEEIIATFVPSEEGTIAAIIPNEYDKGVRSYLHHYERMHALSPGVFEGIKELLNTLKSNHVRLAMVTGKGRESTRISLDQFGMLDTFDPIETGSPKGPKKVEGIKAVLKLWSEIDLDEIIYVGDAPSDITQSKEAGVTVVAAGWATTADIENLRVLEPDYLFLSIKDFSDWLLGVLN